MSFQSDVDNYVLKYDSVNENWALTKGGASRAIRRGESKADLAPEARRIAKNNAPSTLKIETLSGGTSETNEYGEVTSRQF